MSRKEILKMLGIIAAVAVLAVLGVSQAYQARGLKEADAKLDALEQNLAAIRSFASSLATTTAAQISKLQNEGIGKSQEQIITSAVAEATPAVVSIVISEEVQQLQVTYVNPFGNDPDFQNFGFQIPVYQEKGVSLQKIGAGSGFLISHDGYIVTNKHVVSDTNAEYTVLLSDGSQKTAAVVYRDPTYDIAIVKISGTYKTVVSLGSSASLTPGQTVIAIGNALGEYAGSVSVGVISGLDRTIQASDAATGASERLSGVIQTDASINPGNSGGPLIDLNGDVVGINVATAIGSNNIAFAIPIDMVKSILQKVL